MRTIRDDELTYCLFDAMRTWNATDRSLVSGRRPGELERWLDLPAGKLAERLGYVEMFTADGTVLDQYAVRARMGAEILALPADLRRSFASTIERSQQHSRMEAARLMATALGDLHMLADTPEPPPFNLSMGATSGVAPM